MKRTGRIAIIGGGITGLTAAERLVSGYGEKVVVIEKEGRLGGLASTLERDGIKFDMGSHRLHPDCERRAYRYIKELIGGDLLERERRGKLCVRGRYINYPPDIFNFLKTYSFLELLAFIKGFVRSRSAGTVSGDDFESVMSHKYGKEIYDAFYREYAWKIWDKDPRTIEIEGMKRLKVSPDFSTLSKALSLVPHRFYYPRSGIGDIAQKLGTRVASLGGEILLNTNVEAFKREDKRISEIIVKNGEGVEQRIPVSEVLSTIPLDELYFLLSGEEGFLEWRGARFMYMHFDRPIDGESETYYFPNKDVVFGRISEIGRYSPELNPGLKGSFLTVEIPSTRGDGIWRMPDGELLDICLGDMKKARIITSDHKLLGNFVINVDKIYPIYQKGWKEKFNRLYNAVKEYTNLFTVGRRGLFLHINIDHCMIQGLELADHVAKNGTNDGKEWREMVERYSSLSARD